MKNYGMDPNLIRDKISSRSKVIIAPHLFGMACDIEERLNKASMYGIRVIEDCAQAIGADFKGRKAGSFGLLTVFSFYATKVLACGEGGMVLSDSEDLISKVKNLRDYDNRDDYILRYNYKMTDIQASLGLSQLSSLEEFVDMRREIAIRYFKEFKDCNFSLPVWKEGKEHIYYRFVVKAKENVSSYLEKSQEKKVMCRRPVYIPLHVYLNLSGFPNTNEAWQHAVSIPLYPSLIESEIKRVVALVREIF